MGKINVAYITDENYAMPTCVSIVSLVANKHEDTELDIYVLANNVSERRKKAIKQNAASRVAINIIEVSSGVYEALAESCLTKGIHVSSSALLKFDLPNVLAKLDKVLYLDGDIIIQHDLSDLFSTDIGMFYVAAVDDMGDKVENNISSLASRIGMQGNSYFNSGVMLLNLKKIRDEAIDKELYQYRMNNKNYFMDQDAFNYVFELKRKSLPYKYNYRCAIIDELDFDDWNGKFFDSRYTCEDDCIKEQTILHLTDKMKPWDYEIRYFSDIFFKYYNISFYADEKIHLKSPMLEKHKAQTGLLESFDKHIAMSRLRESKMEWHFPREIIRANERIIIYGAGDMGRSFIQQIAENHYCRIILWVDKKHKELGSAIHAPEEIVKCDFDYVLIAIFDTDISKSVADYLSGLGIDKSKILLI